ncbi:MAG: pantoate--beta-alanine ligase [Nitrospirae bacterium]|nr:pantoate--beta-alanine ligase [Nitrospirota bacterium]
MEVIRIPRIMQYTSKNHLLKGKTIGFVPTMGALHEGHLSLVRRARQDNNITVVSIFVNPIQFGPSEDYAKYPRDIEEDTKKLQKENIDILFLPDVSGMYPEDFLTYIDVEKISTKLCGAFRPGHFRGVATVVMKLFNIVKPTSAYFGQKDFQQTVVIKQMVKDLDLDIDIIICPTVRETDGLAMSSRNVYLDTEQRKAATIIYKTLLEASNLIKSGIIDGRKIQKIMQEKILKEPAVTKIDYIGVYDPVTLEEIYNIKKDVLLAAAIRIGSTRLIDNMILNL